MQTSTADFISECLSKNVSALDAMINLAKQEIAEIEKTLHEADIKRVRMNYLNKVVASLEPAQKTEKTSGLSNPTYQIDEDNTEDAIQLRKDICSIIESKGALTNREIIQHLGAYNKDQKVFHALKYLGLGGVIKRDDTSDNKIIPGENWDSR